MFKKEYPFGGFYYEFGPFHLDLEDKYFRCGRLKANWRKDSAWDDNYSLELSLHLSESEVEFPACRSCVQGRPDNCCCI